MLLANRPGCYGRVRPGLSTAPSAAQPICLGIKGRIGLHIRHAAASDEKRRSEPMYLSELIAFESDSDADEPSPTTSSSSGKDASGSSSSSSSNLAGSLGLASSADADATHRAQEIINRATEVLAAARAALGSQATTPAAGAAQSAVPNSSRSSTAGGAAAANTSSSKSGSSAFAAVPSSYQQGQQQATSSPSSSSSGGSSLTAAAAAGPSGPAGGLVVSPTGPSNAAGTSSEAPGSSPPSTSEPLTRRWSQLSDGQDLTRHVLQSALDQMQRSGAPIAAPKDLGGTSSGGGPGTGPSGTRSAAGSAGAAAAAASSGGVRLNRDLRSSSGSSSRGGPGAAKLAGAGADGGHTPAPSWAQSLLGSDDFGGSGGYVAPGYLFPTEIPQLQPQAAAMPAALAFADEPPALTLPPAALGLVSQSVLDTEKAKQAVLPPLQSVLELTTAFKPPERSGGAPAPAAVAVDAVTGEAVAAAVPVGRALADGSGRLADGTWWEKKSGVEYGKNGYWKRWQLLRGGNAEGTLEWEETWWEASDYTGLKEMGAEKKGHNTEGDAWRESWSERLMYASNDLDCVVERNAHKWAAEANGDEWEEKWGEHYHAGGKVAKYADKWGKQGPNVWHERWGEDYESGGDACVKWTDKWAERLLPGGAREQWGDKWREAFANGRGEKNGEVWSVNAGGERYQRWWGEQHLGDMRVRRHGHSTTGDQWDDIVYMDTYYNPVPHFGFKLALQHSPQLRNVPLKPKPVNEKDPFGPGLDKL